MEKGKKVFQFFQKKVLRDLSPSRGRERFLLVSIKGGLLFGGPSKKDRSPIRGGGGKERVLGHLSTKEYHPEERVRIISPTTKTAHTIDKEERKKKNESSPRRLSSKKEAAERAAAAAGGEAAYLFELGKGKGVYYPREGMTQGRRGPG